MGWVEDCLVGSACYNTTKTGSNLVTGLVINLVIGILCYVGFVLWRGRFKIYYARLVLPQVRLKPPPLKLGSHWQLWSWLLPVFQVRDAELLKSAGLDALMSMRVMRFGIMLFTPMTILGVGVILPINYTGNYYKEMGSDWASEYNITDHYTSTFMRMTISNIPTHSNLIWIHFAFLYIFALWACHLLLQYSKEYIALRQVYAVQGLREAAKGLPSSSRHLRVNGARTRRRMSDKHDHLQSEHSLANVQPEGSFASSMGSTGRGGAGGGENAALVAEEKEGQQAEQTEQQSAATKQSGVAGSNYPAAASAAVAATVEDSAAACGQEHSQGQSRGSGSVFRRLVSIAVQDAASFKQRVGSFVRRGGVEAPGGADEVEPRRRSSAVSWGDAGPGGRLSVTALFEEEEEEEEEAVEELESERVLYPGRYTVLVLDEALQRFKLRHEHNRGFLRTALPSFKIRQIDPASDDAVLEEGLVDNKAWRRKPLNKHSKRMELWAESNYRMNVAGRTFTTVFGSDFGSVIPIYQTKEVDAAQLQLFYAEAKRDRLALQLEKLEEDRQAVAQRLGEGLHSNPLFSGQPGAQGAQALAGQQGQQQQQQQEGQEQRDVEAGIAAGAGSAADAAAAPAQGAGAGQQHAEQQQGETGGEKEGDKDGEKEGEKNVEEPTPKAALGPKELARLRARDQQLQGQAEKLAKRVAQAEEAAEAARLAVEAKRREVLEGPPCPSFFVTFKTQEAAMLASQTNLNPMQERMFQVLPAPEPENVNWPTIQRSWWSRTLRPAPVLVAIIAVMLFPMGAFTGIGSQLEVTLCPVNSSGNALDATGTWFCSDDKWAKLFRNVVTSWLPAVLLSVYQAVVLPLFFYTCAQAESFHYSLSSLDKRCASLFFYWNVFNFFLGALLGGSLASAIQAIINGDAKSIINLLGAAIPGASMFFISYVAFQFLAMVPFRLFWPHFQVLVYILKWLHILPWAQTPRDMALETPPRNARFSRDVGIITMAVAIASLAYAVISPLILPFALCYFLSMWAVWRYQMLYVWQPGYDAHGQIWIYASHSFVGCLIVMSVFTAAMLAVKGGYAVALIILFTLVPSLLMFNRLLIERYDKVVIQLPLVTTLNAPRTTIDPTNYAPPPLRDHGLGWHLDWGKAWQYWGVPRYGI